VEGLGLRLPVADRRELDPFRIKAAEKQEDYREYFKELPAAQELYRLLCGCGTKHFLTAEYISAMGQKYSGLSGHGMVRPIVL